MNRNRLMFLIFLLIFLVNFSFGKSSSNDLPKKAFGLALSGGGARGFAHIGVLRRLEEENLEPGLISGSSMGALIGSLYALGYDSYQIESFLKNSDFRQIFINKPKRTILDNYLKKKADRTSLEFYFSQKEGLVLPNSLTSGQLVYQILSELVSSSVFNSTNFDSLKIKLRIVASDINNARRVVFDNGDLVSIITGSIAYPAIFEPVKYKHYLLMDGGLTDNLPSDLIPDSLYKILVDVTFDSPVKDKRYNIVEILDRILITMTNEKMQENKEQSDLIIKPNVTDIYLTEFDKIDTIIKAGYEACDSLITKMKQEVRVKKKQPSEELKASKIIIDGNKQIASDKILQIIKKSSFSSLEHNLLGFYKAKGFIMAKIKTDLSGDSLLVKINEGHLDSILFKGYEKCQLWFLRHSITLKEGDLLTLKKIRRDLKYLYGTGLFSRIKFKIDSKENSLIFTVTEKPDKTIRMGYNYQTDRGFRGAFAIDERNFLGRGIDIGANFIFGEKIKHFEGSIYSAQFKTPSFYNEIVPYYCLKQSPLYLDEKENDFDEERLGLRYNVGLQIFNNYQLNFSLFKEVLFLEKEEYSNENHLEASLIIDNRDHAYFPTKGLYMKILGSKIFKKFDLTNCYHKFWGKFEDYFNLSSYWNFNYSLEFGTADRNVPYFQRFRLGGPASIGGTYFEEFYAKQYLNLKLNNRFKIYKNAVVDCYLGGSYSFWGMWDDPDLNWTINDFNNSVAINLSIDTVLMPMEVGYGLAIGSKEIKSKGRFFVSIGYNL